ncbi:MAG TPA: hypothetical protein VNU24_05335 [Solirubrobacteraceae bacterium]|jgi:hypothetical protein|nr:hypothetical protein [Solirubrobacteraceae bacterium]
MSTMATEAGALVEPPASEPHRPVAAPPTAPQQQPQDAAGGAPAGKKGKASKGKDKKEKGGKGTSAEESGTPSVAAHPRAARAVAQAKAWGGLAGFFIAGYLSLPTGTLAEAAVRALIAGSVCYVAAWAGAVFVWRRLVVIEIKGREQALLAAAQTSLGTGEPASAVAESARAGTAAPPQSLRAGAAPQGR